MTTSSDGLLCLDSMLPWDSTILKLAETLANARSKDPSTKVGCIITTPDHRQMAVGYNGFPPQTEDFAHIWNERSIDVLNKYDLVVHAEMNALLNCQFDRRNALLYVTHLPCAVCLKHIAASGIREVFTYGKPTVGCNTEEHKYTELLWRFGISIHTI